MTLWTSTDAEAATLGHVSSPFSVSGISIDTRSLKAGDLFVALRGARDGHDFLAAAFEAKAAAAMVSRSPSASPGPLLMVADTQRGLEDLARAARARSNARIVAVTGSAGKTTTKEIIAAALKQGYRTAKNEGNLNNHIGVPLSLLRMEETAEVAVLELGMNHAGEIGELAAMAAPETGVVTNVGPAHIENFESIEGIAAAKRELIEALPHSGTAVLNADDARVAAFATSHAGRSVLYGMSENAEVRAEDVHFLPEGVEFRVDGVHFASPLVGRHGVSNLLAGIATAKVYGIEPARLTGTIREFAPGKMRGERFHWRGILVYNDCYNSNPDAVRAMLDVLKEAPARKRIAVLGEMLELGRWAETLHREVGSYAAGSGLNVLVGIRGAACYMVDTVMRSALGVDAAFFFEDPREAGRLVRKLASAGDAVLFKGSRGVHVELALEEFLAAPESGGQR
jgi:UDP-N-acetylmuramoyl-tripeptide--D-alanyl-D-alanine ligase